MKCKVEQQTDCSCFKRGEADSVDDAAALSDFVNGNDFVIKGGFVIKDDFVIDNLLFRNDFDDVIK